jgi:DNA/RNA-binding domain of Phe-tRNA-synthetase-like protein
MSDPQRNFRIENGVFELFPALQIAVMVFNGIDNSDGGRAAMLQAACSALRETLAHSDTLPPHIDAYSQAMKQIKRKKGCLASIEAMAKRLKKGDDIKSINPAVDIYNAVSLGHLIPCGGEDLDCIHGDMVLGFARGDEHFVALGDEENTPPREGELIYRDDDGAVVRSWLWREAERTKITHRARNIVLYMELVDAARQAELALAMNALQQTIVRELGGQAVTAILNRTAPACAI